MLMACWMHSGFIIEFTLFLVGGFAALLTNPQPSVFFYGSLQNSANNKNVVHFWNYIYPILKNILIAKSNSNIRL